MDFPNPLSVTEVSEIIDRPVFGNTALELSGMNEIHRVKKGELVFVDHPKYFDKALQSDASCILINEQVKNIPSGKAIIVSDDPFKDFNLLTEKFNSFNCANKAVSTSAKIGKRSIIQPNCFIDDQVSIGEDCIIHPGVQIYGKCTIGNRVEIHANTVIGGHAFYYKKRPSGYDKLKSSGSVKIGDDVEIGANCTIDRGVSAVTSIGDGTKLDNLIQIGHDTIIGKNCLFASQVGIAGCVAIEDDVILWGQVGVASDIVIGKGAIVLAQSGVGNNLEPGKKYFGSPAKEARETMREMAALKTLPKIIKKLS